MVRPALQGAPHQATGPTTVVALMRDILRGVMEQALDRSVIDAELVAQTCRHSGRVTWKTAVIKHTFMILAHSAAVVLILSV